MLELKFIGKTLEEIKQSMRDFFINEIPADTLVKAPAEEPPKPVEPPKPAEPIKPVVSQAQQAENLAKAPVHKEPPQPTFDDMRDALLNYRAKHGPAKLGKLLEDFGAKKAQDVKPEDYLGIIDRAKSEV